MSVKVYRSENLSVRRIVVLDSLKKQILMKRINMLEISLYVCKSEIIAL